MLTLLKKRKPADSSSFSEFIRSASSAEKKRVYSDVLKKATERQNKMAGKPVTKSAAGK